MFKHKDNLRSFWRWPKSVEILFHLRVTFTYKLKVALLPLNHQNSKKEFQLRFRTPSTIFSQIRQKKFQNRLFRMFFYNLVSWRRFFCLDGRTFKRLGPVESSPSVCSGGSSSGREEASRPEDPGLNPIGAGLFPHLLLLSSIDFFSRRALAQAAN